MDIVLFSKSSIYLAVILYLTFVGFRWARSFLSEWQLDKAIGIRNGCLPQPQLPNQWPLGLDWVRKLWHSDSQQHPLAFLCNIVRNILLFLFFDSI